MGEKRGLPRKAGHSQGAKVFRRTVEDCRDIGIKYCTFYAFSTENWKRPKDEVDAIMKLLVKYLDDIRSMAQKNTRIIFLGDKSAFDDDIQARLVEIEEISKNNDGLYVLVALNYGGKDEILTAAKRLARDYKEGKVDLDGFTEDDFDNYLYTKGIPPGRSYYKTERRAENLKLPYLAGSLCGAFVYGCSVAGFFKEGSYCGLRRVRKEKQKIRRTVMRF